MRRPLFTQTDPETAEKIIVAGEVLGIGMLTSFSLNFILNLIVSQGLNLMLGLIKSLQVIVHLTLVNVIIPANAMLFFSMIFEIIAFDPIDIED